MEYFSDHTSDYELKPLQFQEDLDDTATSQKVVLKGVAPDNVKTSVKFQVKDEEEGQNTVGGEEEGQLKVKYTEGKKGKGVVEVRREEKGKRHIEVGRKGKAKRQNIGLEKNEVGSRKKIHVSKSASRNCNYMSMSDSSSFHSANESTNELANFWFCPPK